MAEDKLFKRRLLLVFEGKGRMNLTNEFGNYLVKRRSEITKTFINGKVLDLSCGPAKITEFCKIKEYVGTELRNETVFKLKKKFSKFRFYQLDLTKDSLKINDKFDTILLIAVIEHIEHIDNLYKIIYEHLKDDGNLIITTPTPMGNFVHTLLAYIGLTSKSAVKGHVNIYNLKKLKKEIEKYGFQLFYYKKFEFNCNQLFVIGKK